MRIIQVTNRYPPAIGGVEEYVKNLSNSLAAKDHKIIVLTSNLAKNNSREKLDCSKIVKTNNIEIKRISSFSFPTALMYTFFLSLPFYLIKTKTDIIHAHCFWYNPADVASIISKIKNIPFVFNPYYYPREGLRWKLYKKIIGRITMNADVTIVLSKYEQKLIEAEGFTFKRIEIVSPGIKINEFKNINFNIYSEDFHIKKSKIILFVGRIDYGKGIDILINAASIVLKEEPDILFFIVGPCFGEMKKLKILVENLGIDRNFIFAGELERKKLISAYKNATIFILPSRYEAFGIVLIEAMASRIPIIASNCSAIPYIIEHEKNGLLFNLGDVKDLAHKILSLLKNEKKCKVLAEEGYKTVKKKYDWMISINKLEKIYKSLI